MIHPLSPLLYPIISLLSFFLSFLYKNMRFVNSWWWIRLRKTQSRRVSFVFSWIQLRELEFDLHKIRQTGRIRVLEGERTGENENERQRDADFLHGKRQQPLLLNTLAKVWRKREWKTGNNGIKLMGFFWEFLQYFILSSKGSILSSPKCFFLFV